MSYMINPCTGRKIFIGGRTWHIYPKDNKGNIICTKLWDKNRKALWLQRKEKKQLQVQGVRSKKIWCNVI